MSLSRGMQLKVISAGQLKSRGPAQALSVAAIGTGQRAFRHCPCVCGSLQLARSFMNVVYDCYPQIKLLFN